MAYIGKAPPITTNLLEDADQDTKIQVEESADEDIIRFDIAGAEDFTMSANNFTVLSGSTLTVASGATITNNGTANGFGALAGIDDQSSSNDDQITISDTAVIINEDSDDLDFRIESNGNTNAFDLDGGLHGGVGAVGIGRNAENTVDVLIGNPAITADANQSHYRLRIVPAGAVTIPSGTAAEVATLSVFEPNITATGTVTAAASVWIHSAPTEASSNYALFVDDGVSRFDGNIQQSTGINFIGDTANADMTTGLTINQSGADNEALALKSSDVSHGATDFGETDTYGLFQKVSSSDGGLMIRGFSDGAVGMELRAMNTTNDTSDSSGSVGTMTLRSSLKTSGNTNDTNVGATGNLIVFRDLTSTRVVIKGDGTVHAQDTSWATSLDTEDDMLALRMLDKAQSTKGVIDSAWDSMIGTDWKYLQKIGVAGSDHPEKGHPDMFSMQGIQKLTMGATWYLGQNFMAFLETIEKRMPGIRKEFEDHMLEQSGRPAMLTQSTN